ncbi:MAG: hypothetical protein LBH92_02490 [Bacteroidales bacterium]|jgi:hypothetical protein|nr:hypothetical protein [Bacteroidales bacterium]
MEVREFLATQTDGELFEYFKSGETLDFPKRIAAGKILRERGFDENILQEEKQKIITEIEQIIAQYDDPKSIVKRNRRKLNFYLYYIIGFYLLFILTVALRGYHNGAPFDWIGASLLTGIVVLILIVRLAKYKTALSKRIQKDYDNLSLQKIRLKVIETEWDF